VIPNFLAPAERLRVARALWTDIEHELRVRGGGVRESGAFLLAPPDRRHVIGVAYYDDLDPSCFVGSIDFHGSGYSALWDHCERLGMRVIADVHTHPSSNVSQSQTDRRHPMIAQRGHVGLILPNFAEEPVPPRELGFHVYHGDRGWSSHRGRAAARRLKLVNR
jgi:hypothetical protein